MASLSYISKLLKREENKNKKPSEVFDLLRKEDADREEDSFFQFSDELVQNLADSITLRPYQKDEALTNFITYYNANKDNIKLAFHMATGSGKTVVMAALILYLYEQGYRNFIFLVNSTAIIEKTFLNFMDPNSPKYLFAQDVRIGRNIP
jgi:type III restriction enzyme